MTPEGWVVNLVAIIAATIGAYQSYGAKDEARQAKNLSKPTGNGFAGDTEDTLQRIEKITNENRSMLIEDRLAAAHYRAMFIEHLREHLEEKKHDENIPD